MIDSLSKLIDIFQNQGANRFYAKKMAPNDNSKNQVYLGGDFSALNIIPHNEIYSDDGDQAGAVRNRMKADVTFAWVDEEGAYVAPDTKLILYPKYPEVRMSGFLNGCKKPPSKIMTVRDEGRVLLLGITPDRKVLGFAVDAHHPIAQEIQAAQGLKETGVFLELTSQLEQGSSKDQLLNTLKQIYERRWIPSQKLSRDGIKEAYRARNGGGYTLEAELGISPNGFAEPDYLGWEIKQYGVADFQNFRPKSPVTLFTPEPTHGLYRDAGVEGFLHEFGYPDKSGKPDRINFGGVYACGKDFHADTNLRLDMIGFDKETNKITDLDGGIALLDRRDRLAALWSYKGIIEHWNRKHAQAAYIPSIFRAPPPEYSYGPRVYLCEDTDLNLFLGAIANGVVYYDPAIKLEDATSASPKLKRRSQFRIKHAQLDQLYNRSETVELAV